MTSLDSDSFQALNRNSFLKVWTNS